MSQVVKKVTELAFPARCANCEIKRSCEEEEKMAELVIFRCSQPAVGCARRIIQRKPGKHRQQVYTHFLTV